MNGQLDSRFLIYEHTLSNGEETIQGRTFTFKRERYVLGDGTEVIWSVGESKRD